MNTIKRFGKLLVLLAVVLLCALLLPGRGAQAAISGTCGAEGDGSNLTWTLDDSGKLTISGTGLMRDKYRPWGTSIKAVVIESGVTSIGNGAFCVCSSLTSVTIPDSVTSIGGTAFSGCSNLMKVTIGNGVTTIGEYAFFGCSSLMKVTIGNGVKSIGEHAFSICSSLTSVHITDIAAWCTINFGGYDTNPLYYAHKLYLNGELVTNLTIPEGVTSIGEYAFYSCSGLTSVTMPASVTSIGDNAFYGCSGLKSVTLGNGVTSIGEYAIYGCSGLTEVLVAENNPSFCVKDGVLLTKDLKRLILCPAGKSGEYRIPHTVERIDTYAFEYSKLTRIVLDVSTDTIQAHMFSGCSGLKELVIVKGVTIIAANAFSSCWDLKDVYYTGTEAEWTEVLIAPSGNGNLLNATVHFDYVLEPTPDDPRPAIVPGDLSGDGVLTMTDVTALFVVLSDPAAEKDPALMDVNGDGKVNARDAMLLFRELTR